MTNSEYGMLYTVIIFGNRQMKLLFQQPYIRDQVTGFTFTMSAVLYSMTELETY